MKTILKRIAAVLLAATMLLGAACTTDTNDTDVTGTETAETPETAPDVTVPRTGPFSGATEPFPAYCAYIAKSEPICGGPFSARFRSLNERKAPRTAVFGVDRSYGVTESAASGEEIECKRVRGRGAAHERL